MMSQALWFVRHGNREDFVDPEWARSAERPFDPGLSPDGIEQARRTGQRLVGEGIMRIFASPFLRGVQTANCVAEALDLPIFLEDGMGEWENPAWFPESPARLSKEELARRYPRIDPGYEPVLVPTFPETFEQADWRTGETVRRVLERYPTETLLFVGHGVSATGGVRGLIPDMYVYECALCALFRVHRNGHGWVMDLCADTAHLDEALGAGRLH